MSVEKQAVANIGIAAIRRIRREKREGYLEPPMVRKPRFEKIKLSALRSFIEKQSKSSKAREPKQDPHTTLDPERVPFLNPRINHIRDAINGSAKATMRELAHSQHVVDAMKGGNKKTASRKKALDLIRQNKAIEQTIENMKVFKKKPAVKKPAAKKPAKKAVDPYAAGNEQARISEQSKAQASMMEQARRYRMNDAYRRGDFPSHLP